MWHGNGRQSTWRLQYLSRDYRVWSPCWYISKESDFILRKGASKPDVIDVLVESSRSQVLRMSQQASAGPQLPVPLLPSNCCLNTPFIHDLERLLGSSRPWQEHPTWWLGWMACSIHSRRDIMQFSNTITITNYQYLLWCEWECLLIQGLKRSSAMHL